MITATYNPIQTRRWHEKDPLYVSFRLGVIDLTMTAELNGTGWGVPKSDNFEKEFSSWIYSTVPDEAGISYRDYVASFDCSDTLAEIKEELHNSQHGRKYEQWRECPGVSSDYQFSSFGRVRSKRGMKRTAVRKLLVPAVSPMGGIVWREQEVQESDWKILTPTATRGRLTIGGLYACSSYLSEGHLLPPAVLGIRNGHIFGGSKHDKWSASLNFETTPKQVKITERLDTLILYTFYDLLASVGHSAVGFGSSTAIKLGVEDNELENVLRGYFELPAGSPLTEQHVLQMYGMFLPAVDILRAVRVSGNANWFFDLLCSMKKIIRDKKNKVSVAAVHKRVVDRVFSGEITQDFQHVCPANGKNVSLADMLGLEPEHWTEVLNSDPIYAKEEYVAKVRKSEGHCRLVDVSETRKKRSKEAAGGPGLTETERFILRPHHNNLQPWDCRIDNLRWVASYDYPAAIGDGQISACGSKKAVPGLCRLKTGLGKFNLNTNDLTDLFDFFEKKFEQDTYVLQSNNVNHTPIPIRSVISAILKNHGLSKKTDDLMFGAAVDDITEQHMRELGHSFHKIMCWYDVHDPYKFDGLNNKTGLDADKKLQHNSLADCNFNLQIIADKLGCSIGFVSEKYKSFKLLKTNVEIVSGIFGLLERIKEDYQSRYLALFRPRELAAEGKIRYVLSDPVTADRTVRGSAGDMSCEQFVAAGGNKDHVMIRYSSTAVGQWIFDRWVEQRKKYSVNYNSLFTAVVNELQLPIAKETFRKLLQPFETKWERDIGDEWYTESLKGVNAAALQEEKDKADRTPEVRKNVSKDGFDWDAVVLDSEQDDE